MPRKETLSQFADNLHKFPLIIQKRIVKDWQNYTEESFADSQEKVPILSGDLLRSGVIKNAKITANGIESFITYTMPYANYIHGGKNKDGSDIRYKESGEESNGYTKARKGEAEYLSKPVKDNEPEVIKDIMDSIGKAWAVI